LTTRTPPPPGLRAAAGHSSTSTSTVLRGLSGRPALCVAVAITTVTLLAALASSLLHELGPATAPHPTLHGTAAEALSIASHNARTLVAPLLLCAGRWHTGRLTRHVGDLVVAALVTANAAMIGLALGRYPTQLPAYLPHLPLEDAALAIAAGAWLARRRRSHASRAVPELARTAVLVLAVTIAAAIVETYAVPHKG
jgi:hypothetical protein